MKITAQWKWWNEEGQSQVRHQPATKEADLENDVINQDPHNKT